jgi:pyridoxal phosphate enzyme (YggS family)
MSPDVQQRVEAVQARIADACRRCGRDPAGVHLIAVSKTHSADRVAEVAACGLSVFGENRVQEARAKIPLCPSHLTWHLVGHLQRNKAVAAAEVFDLIHSVDSLRLLETLNQAGDQLGRTVRVLLEVNVSGEASKFGLTREEVPVLLEAANRLKRVEVRGLMTIPPLTDDVEKARPHFRRLREWRDEWRLASGHALDELSMGMSHDLDVAIEEGAYWVRVGTALFGERERPPLTAEELL